MGSHVSISLLILALSISLQISSSRKVGLKLEEAKVEPIFRHENENSSARFDPSKGIRLSWHPRAFLYKGFLSEEECEHLISQAHDKQVKSLAKDNDAGNNTLNSRGFLARGQDELIAKIEERISAWTFLPKENGEDIQILRHGINESHAPNNDYYHERSNIVNGGNRVATLLMYLSTVPRGGETVFPKSEVKHGICNGFLYEANLKCFCFSTNLQLKDTQAKDETWSDCAATGFAVKPVKGDALLLFNLHPNGTVDESSLHGSCKALEGEKWSATKWIHMRAFNADRHSTSSLVSDEECTDEDDNCSHWAAKGECQRNPVYMLGTPDYYGSCRKSCGACLQSENIVNTH